MEKEQAEVKNKAVIDLSAKEARQFFLESESYCNVDLPEYFDFKMFLEEIIPYSCSNSFTLKDALLDNTSHKIYTNKDGKYAWRKFELIHPILYLEFLKIIIDDWQFIQNHFQNNKKDKIYSCPIYTRSKNHKKQKKTQILAYLEDIENKSILKSYEFKYMSKLDITDCYPSIYTHSVAWALHTQKEAKSNQKNRYTKRGKTDQSPLLGNDLDYLLRLMQKGQTNGIPQGSALMDLVAEIILTYIDKLLAEKLELENIKKYEIIRYRDDYRIFTIEKSDNAKIIGILSDILMEFNFKLNSSKTEIGEDIILMSIKKDKLENIVYHIGTDKEIDVFKLKRLLLDILKISKSYPNSGFICKTLQHFNERKFYSKKSSWYPYDNIEILVAILLEIGTNNPRCLPIVCVSIFNLVSLLSEKKKYTMYDIVYRKLLAINNIGFNEIWVQRCLYKVDTTKEYSDKICSVVYNKEKESIFGNHFITDKDLIKLLNKNNFINIEKLDKLSKIPSADEVDIFINYY